MQLALSASGSVRAPRSSVMIPAVLAGICLLLTASMLAIAIAQYLRTGDGIGGDFLTDYAGGYLVRTGQGDQLYDLETQERTQYDLSPAGEDDDVNPFVLPPAAAFVFAPLTKLPYRTAHIVFTAINLTALGGVLLLLRDELRSTSARLRRVFLAVFALSMPAVTLISWGQIDLLLVAAMLLGWRLLRTDRDALAGVAFSLAVVKPHFLVGVVALLVLQRRWAALGALAAIGTVFFAPAAVALRGAMGDYLGLVTGATHLPEHIDTQPHHMANMRGLVTSLSGTDSARLWMPALALVALTTLAASVREWRRSAASPRAYALAIVLPLLLSPHVHMQSMLLLFVAAAVILRARADAGGDDDGLVPTFLWLHVALFVGWFLTANNIAVMVIIVLSVFAWCATAAVREHDVPRSRELANAA